MSVKYYNPKTAQWEAMATSQAQGVKVIDSDGVLTYEDGEEVIRPTNVEDGLKSLGRKIKDIETTLEDHFTNHPSGSGGGGGGGTGFMPVLTIQSPEVISTTVDEDVIFEFQFTSPNVGIAQAYLEVSGTENRAYQMTLRRQGNFVGVSGWNLGKFPMGTYTVSMYVVDAAGMYATMSSSCIIRSGSLTLTSNFVDSVDFFVSSNIYFPYYVQSISEDPITVKYQIDSNAEVALENIENGSYGSIDMGKIPVTGSHVIKVWAESGNMKSNVLRYTVLVVDARGMYLTVNLEKEEFEEGEAVTLYYRASKQNESYVTAFFYIDGILTGSQSVAIGASTLWNLGKGLDAGDHTLKIKVRTLDTTDATENMETNTAIWEQTIKIKAGEFASIQPIKDGSELFIFDASGLAGEGATDANGNHIWKDKGRNNVKCTLHDFNFTAATGGNGWDGDSLIFSGKSYAVIDCSPFNNSTNTGILADGFTLEICFSATDVGNPDASVLWCKNHLAPNQGINATPYAASLKSQDGISMATSYIDSSYGEKWTTLSFSIKHYDATKPFETMCCYIYVNGVLTRLEPCTSNLFKYNGKIYLGAGLLENGKIGNFANCKIKSIRAYNRQLSENTMTIQGKTVLADETLINYISDQPLTKNVSDTILTQQELWELNYGTETMPVVDIYHPNFFAMTVNDTFSCGIKYNDPTTGQGFDLTDSSGGDVNSAGPCPVSIQGTSSANYPVKNYTIELMQGGTYFKYAPRDNWEAGYRFTLKANEQKITPYSSL